MGDRGRGFATSMRVITWNVEWATRKSRRTAEIVGCISGHDPEVVCLTEAHVGLLSQHGHTICSQADYGYKVRENRRKVVLWSREPWREVDDVGLESMPPGRFVAGVTRTSLDDVTVVGVCIPWFGSRTEARRELGRSKRWEDHEEYLVGMTEILGRCSTQRMIVMGDFNQIIGPGSRASHELRTALANAFSPNMRIATSELTFQGRKSIDHIALSEDFKVESLGVVSNIHDGRKLSDHFGVVAELS